MITTNSLKHVAAAALLISSPTSAMAEVSNPYPAPEAIGECVESAADLDLERLPVGMTLPINTNKASVGDTGEAKCLVTEGVTDDGDKYYQIIAKHPQVEKGKDGPSVIARRIFSLESGNITEIDTIEAPVDGGELGRGTMKVTNVGNGSYFYSITTKQNHPLPVADPKNVWPELCKSDSQMAEAMQGAIGAMSNRWDGTNYNLVIRCF